MGNCPSYADWFMRLTGHQSGPRPWQSSLASEPTCRNLVIRIPTGLGKMEGRRGDRLFTGNTL